MRTPPETHYAKCGDLSIAYQVVGDAPLDLVVVPGIISHVEFFHELPGYSRFVERLAAFARVITFDKRGTGLSDRIPDAPTYEDRMDDITAVMRATGCQRTALFGISEGGSLSAQFAATYPERVSALILFGAFARISWAPDYPIGVQPETFEQAQELEQWGTGWGTGVSLGMMSALVLPRPGRHLR
jgi:pimeloyl-ACP methyl ester carboxylesterase